MRTDFIDYAVFRKVILKYTDRGEGDKMSENRSCPNEGYAADTAALQGIFKVCPRCQAPEPRIGEARMLTCSACGLQFFFNTAAAAGAFIFQGSKLILCVRSKDPGRGLLDVPGGFVEFGESVESGLRREILEELSIEVGTLHYFTSAPNRYLYQGIPYHTLDLFFAARTEEQSLIPERGEIEAIELVDPEGLDPQGFAFASTRLAFLKLKDWIRANPL